VEKLKTDFIPEHLLTRLEPFWCTINKTTFFAFNELQS